ncbi:MAG: hypothetical protein IKU10_04710, partial [Clostridia bacterium]|nr:hypothetical protein [Clostridia bacterium]
MKRIKKKLKIIVCVICILAMMIPVSSSGAYLVHTSNNDTTTMTKGAINVSVVTSGTNNPSQLKVKNNGTVPCWVRVIIDVNWV